MIKCKFEYGNEASLRHVTTGAIIRRKDGKILLTRRAKNIHNGGLLTLPGGFLDRDEDATEGIIREIAEETGIKARNVRLFKVNTSPLRRNEDRQNVDLIFLAECVNSDTKENKEASEFNWITEDELPDEKEFAFDHRDTLVEYFKYMKNQFKLPLFA